jgi:thiol:disulfide interchange protein
MSMTLGKWSRFLLVFAVAMLATASFAQVKAHWSLNAPSGNPKPGDVVHFDVRATVDPGWHVYGLVKTDGPTPATIEPTGGAKLAGPVTEAQPIKKLDPNFGIQVEYFESAAVFHVPVKLGPNGLGDSLKIGYQTCNDTTCIPPSTIELPLSGKSASLPPPAGASTGPKIVHNGDQGVLAFVFSAFLAGLLALLTPCVFPMVPITVSFFAKRRETLGSKAGLAHALAYCAGIISAFTAFGIIVTAVFGASGIQRFATNPWVNGVLAVVFVLLALNLFGLYQLNLPSGLQNRFSPQGRSGLVAPLLMGLTFTLTSFTCTVPFVGTILVSAASGSYLYPLLGMLAFSTAFALPFFLLAMFPQYLSRLPRSGSWLEMVKGFMGFLELAAALKFLSNADLVLQTGLISRSTFLIVWTLILAASAVFLLGWLRIGHIEVPKKIGAGRIVTIAVVCVLCTYLGLGTTGRSVGELEAFMPPTPSKGWGDDYDRALALAKQTGRPVLINFTGVTCSNCRWMEKNMFPRDDVRAELKNYVLVELYTDRQRPGDIQNGKLEQELTGSVTLPSYTAVSPEGKVRIVFPGSTRAPKDFVSFLQAGLTGS